MDIKRYVGFIILAFSISLFAVTAGVNLKFVVGTNAMLAEKLDIPTKSNAYTFYKSILTFYL